MVRLADTVLRERKTMTTKLLLANAKTHAPTGFGWVIFHDLLPTLALSEIFKKQVGFAATRVKNQCVVSRSARSGAVQRGPNERPLIVHLA